MIAHEPCSLGLSNPAVFPGKCGGYCASQNTVCRKAATAPCFTFSNAHSNSPGTLRL
ncbi:hypothetical protein RLOC_00011984, partial [Lonchura striata]